MRLHHLLLKHQRQKQRGFTLTELLIAASVGSLVALGASDLMLSNTKSSAALEATHRVRSDPAGAELMARGTAQVYPTSSAQSTSVVLQ